MPKTVSAKFDNVGCFLIQAGFDAMVPGKHDFYYGPGGLQSLAQYLHGAKSTSILGSNLFVVTHTARPDPTPPPTASVGPKSQAKLVLPSTVLPWLHQIELQTAGPADFSEVWDCLAESDSQAPADPTRKTGICQRWVAAGTIPSQVQENGEPVQRSTYRAPALPQADPNAATPATSRAAVAPGHHYLYLKVNQKGGGIEWDRSRTFDVQSPLLQRLADGVQADPGDPDVFHLKEYDRDGEKFWVAVFGVVDPGLRAHIGKLNYSYVFESESTPHADSFDTDVQISDPLESLKQALQACAVDEHCRTARKVLLAQMARSDALMLSARVNSLDELQRVPPFELVVAQADDGQWTGDADTFTEMRPYGGASGPMIVVPEPPRYPVNGGAAYTQSRKRRA